MQILRRRAWTHAARRLLRRGASSKGRLLAPLLTVNLAFVPCVCPQVCADGHSKREQFPTTYSSSQGCHVSHIPLPRKSSPSADPVSVYTLHAAAVYSLLSYSLALMSHYID